MRESQVRLVSYLSLIHIYKPDSGVVSQIKVIKRLFDTSEHIIVATDAGREGELILSLIHI